MGPTQNPAGLGPLKAGDAHTEDPSCSGPHRGPYGSDLCVGIPSLSPPAPEVDRPPPPEVGRQQGVSAGPALAQQPRQVRKGGCCCRRSPVPPLCLGSRDVLLRNVWGDVYLTLKSQVYVC